MSVSLVIFGQLERWLLKPTKRNASILTVVPYSKYFVQDGLWRFRSKINTLKFRFMDNPDNYGAMHYPPIEMLTRGAYAYYVHQYLKWFKREQILILNSNDLKYQPAQVLKQVQEFMGVPVAVDEKNFIMDEESGHYCIIGKKHTIARNRKSSTPNRTHNQRERTQNCPETVSKLSQN